MFLLSGLQTTKSLLPYRTLWLGKVQLREVPGTSNPQTLGIIDPKQVFGDFPF